MIFTEIGILPTTWWTLVWPTKFSCTSIHSILVSMSPSATFRLILRLLAISFISLFVFCGAVWHIYCIWVYLSRITYVYIGGKHRVHHWESEKEMTAAIQKCQKRLHIGGVCCCQPSYHCHRHHSLHKQTINEMNESEEHQQQQQQQKIDKCNLVCLFHAFHHFHHLQECLPSLNWLASYTRQVSSGVRVVN